MCKLTLIRCWGLMYPNWEEIVSIMNRYPVLAFCHSVSHWRHCLGVPLILCFDLLLVIGIIRYQISTFCHFLYLSCYSVIFSSAFPLLSDHLTCDEIKLFWFLVRVYSLKTLFRCPIDFVFWFIAGDWNNTVFISHNIAKCILLQMNTSCFSKASSSVIQTISNLHMNICWCFCQKCLMCVVE